MQNLLAQMRQRSVFRVATAYIVAGWVILEFGSLLFDNFGAPDWVIKVFTTVIFLGFPVACLIAWALEVTPEGIRATGANDPEFSATPRRSDWVWGGVLALVLVVASGNYLQQWRTGLKSVESAPAIATDNTQLPGQSLSEQSSTQPQATPSIAVLPFVDLSQSKDQQYLGDGIAGELLNALASVGGIYVAARTSSFSFHGKGVAVGEIGETLGVSHVLEGSVRRGGDRLRVTTQLIDVNNGFQLFSHSYDRSTGDLFAVQNEIAQEIVTALLPSFGRTKQTQLVNQRTDNIQAYELLLKARYAFFHATPGSLLEAIDYMRQALTIDPQYWDAWGGLAFANTYISFMSNEPIDVLSKADEAASRALEHQADSATALLAKALTAYFIHFDHQTADAYYQQALEHGGDRSVVSFSYSLNLLMPMGRNQEAITILEKARREDPLATLPYAALCALYRVTGQLDEAVLVADRLLAEGTPAAWYIHMAIAYVAADQLQKADRAYEGLEQALGPDVAYTRYVRILLHDARGEKEKIRALLDELLIQRKRGQDPSPVVIGAAYSRLGDEAQAIDWFRRAIAQRESFAVPVIAVMEREFTPIDRNPLYQALLKRMSLPLEVAELVRKYPAPQGEDGKVASAPR